MNFSIHVMFLALLVLPIAHAELIDGRVTQVRLPPEDITLHYIESKGAFTVKLETINASVEGVKMYVGDGTVAVELIAHATDGIFLQGKNLLHGEKLKKGSTIELQPGYKMASDLSPGCVYVTLPGLSFKLPGE